MRFDFRPGTLYGQLDGNFGYAGSEKRDCGVEDSYRVADSCSLSSRRRWHCQRSVHLRLEGDSGQSHAAV